VNALSTPVEEKQRLIAQAKEAMTGPVQRGYRTLFATLDEVEPRAKGNNGAWSLPRGADYYASNLRAQTTTDLDADQIHQIGLDQVKRIHGEMERIKTQVGFKARFSNSSPISTRASSTNIRTPMPAGSNI
jgi:uncharacterized protein (DUF885 family)